MSLFPPGLISSCCTSPGLKMPGSTPYLTFILLRTLDQVQNPSCFVMWDFHREITNSLPHHAPAACPPSLTSVPQRLQGQIIMWAHTIPATGHPGTLKTHKLFSVKSWWPSMWSNTHRYITSRHTLNVNHWKTHAAPVPQCFPKHWTLPLIFPNPSAPLFFW